MSIKHTYIYISTLQKSIYIYIDVCLAIYVSVVFLLWGLILSKWTPPRERTKSNVEAGAILGASGVDGTQNDSTRTAKSNGAERTVEMEYPIVYILF